MEGKEGWVVVEALPDDAVVKETNERKVTTHDEVEDILETEEVQHLGNASNDVSHFFFYRFIRNYSHQLSSGAINPGKLPELIMNLPWKLVFFTKYPV